MSIEKLIGRDYYPPTKVVGYLTSKVSSFFNVKEEGTFLLIRLFIHIALFGFLAFGIPSIVGVLTGDYLFDSIEMFLAFIWLAVGGILIDLFEYAVDDFWVRYEKVSNLSKKEFEDLKKEYNGKIFSKKYLIFSVIAYLIMFPLLFETLKGHTLTVIVMVDILMIFAALMWGIVIYLTLYMYYFVKQITKKPIELNPFNPDGFGGLSIIGSLPLRVAALISSGSLYIPIGINRMFLIGTEKPTGIVIFIGVLIISSAIALTFFVPLFPVNRLAKKTKNELLVDFGNKLKRMIEEPHQKDDQKICLKTLVEIEHYKEIKKMKVWPFSTKMIFELVGYILLPTLLTLIGWILQTT